MSRAVPLLVLAALAVPLLLASAEPKKKSPLEELSWLEGHWKGPFEGGTWESVYSAPEGGLITGMSKELSQGRVNMFEFETFRQAEAGKVFLTPYPNGDRSVDFELTDFDPKVKRARFVNAAHDFPQEIVFERVGKSGLVAEVGNRVEGVLQGFRLDLTKQ